jgi:SP family arabinose:H+ symporter-like MFS transporter
MSFESDRAVVAVSTPTSRMVYLLAISGVAALGGLLFGYDTAVISGAIGYLESHFQLDTAATGWAASSALVGCIIGAAGAGQVGDRFGRKPSLLACGVLFAVTAVWSALPNSLSELAMARILGGVAIGGSSVLAPLYLAEIAPAALRGILVSLNQLGIVVGIVAAFFVNYLIQASGTEAWNIETGWRWMFVAAALPAVVFFCLLFFIPESPRWLFKQGRLDSAKRILERISSPEIAAAQMREIGETLREEQGRFGELFGPGLRRPLVLGVGLAFFQQMTGINAIMYYAPEVFKSSGASTDSAFFQAISVGGVNLLFTLVAMAMIDRFGRRFLMIIGALLQAVFLLGVWWSFQQGAANWWVLAFVLLYVAAFACSFGPVVWVVISEIFPTRIRGRAMSLATLTLWVACYLVSQTFPMLVERIGAGNSFLVYAAMSLVSLVFIVWLLPETKGRTLEEIQHDWQTSADAVPQPMALPQPHEL